MDNKKIIQMVAIIGILCLFVGIATRIRQNSQVTLADYEPPTQTTANNDQTAESDGTTPDTTSDTNSGNAPDTDNNTNNNGEVGIGSVDNDSNSSSILSEMTQEEYDAFYYTDNDDGTSQLHLLYYNNEHALSSGCLDCNSEDAYDLLLIFYKLYKNHYEFTSILPLENFEDEEAARAANNTYCKDGIISINPLYNPFITYEGSDLVLSPENALDYMDRSMSFPYKITDDDYAYTLFTEVGYYWGGHCNGYKDYSSFRK